MLLEFQGKHYNHRETNRERYYIMHFSPSIITASHTVCVCVCVCRFYRYDTHESSQGMKNIKRDR